MEFTQNQLNRTKKDWEYIAGESLKVEFVGGTIYGYGSELATLRLLKKYRLTENARASYSDNLDAQYFALDLPGY